MDKMIGRAQQKLAEELQRHFNKAKNFDSGANYSLLYLALQTARIDCDLLERVFVCLSNDDLRKILRRKNSSDDGSILEQDRFWALSLAFDATIENEAADVLLISALRAYDRIGTERLLLKVLIIYLTLRMKPKLSFETSEFLTDLVFRSSLNPDYILECTEGETNLVSLQVGIICAEIGLANLLHEDASFTFSILHKIGDNSVSEVTSSFDSSFESFDIAIYFDFSCTKEVQFILAELKLLDLQNVSIVLLDNSCSKVNSPQSKTLKKYIDERTVKVRTIGEPFKTESTIYYANSNTQLFSISTLSDSFKRLIFLRDCCYSKNLLKSFASRFCGKELNVYISFISEEVRWIEPIEDRVIYKLSCGAEHVSSKLKFFLNLLTSLPSEKGSIVFGLLSNLADLESVNRTVSISKYCLAAYICSGLDSNGEFFLRYSRAFVRYVSKNVSHEVINTIMSFERSEINELQKSFLFFLFSKKFGEDYYLTFLSEKIIDTSTEEFSEVYTMFDPVNRVGLSSAGLKFCADKPLLKVIFSKLDKLRIASVTRKKVSPQHSNSIVVVLARLFPDNINVGSNSHYNILKIYCNLINVYNEKLCEKDRLSLKVIFTGEKDFRTPFLVRTQGRTCNRNNNFEFMIGDGIIKDQSSFFDFSSKPGLSKAKRVESACKLIDELKPLSTLFLGGTYDSKITRSKVYEHHPVAFIPTTGSVDNAYGKPDIHVDVVRAVNEYHKHLLIEFGIPENAVIHFSKPMFEENELPLFDWNWSKYWDPNQNYFSIVTPLVGGRISRWLLGLTEFESKQFIKLFDNNKYLKWVFVGERESTFSKVLEMKPELKKLLDNKSIIRIDYTDNLGGLIENSNLVFIPTLGGATTVAAATSVGTPSLVDYRSDSTTVVPTLGHFHSFEEGFDLINEISINDSIGKRIVEESKTLLSKRRDLNNIAESFVSFLQEARSKN
ncbi:hypothetical protein [Aliiglaciecola sp. M165]|uniref:hypothetical protein n=1 Tax=Aliiglaciecola sp. M165 TaxID=2593649 RepID=UPI00117F2ED0|nr:hypothetical protein [Aliiglaciecola sp. M165]TRY30771.1 hypothetical protein FM019_12860 [Aliiglaciecola sp. M165]